MSVALLFKALFAVAALLAPLPLLVFAERRRIGLAEGDSIRAIGWRPLRAELAQLLLREDEAPPGKGRVLSLAAPVLIILPALSAFALIPIAGVYAAGDSQLRMVVASPDWGVLYIFALGAFASAGVLLAGWADNTGVSLEAGLRAAGQLFSYGVGLALSTAGLVVLYGSLELPEMVLAQDRTFRVFGGLEALGVAPSAWLLGSPFILPAWGLFLQPLGFALFFACSLGQSLRPPFDAARRGTPAVRAGAASAYGEPGGGSGLLYLAELVGVVLCAALLTTLFLGGWSLPFASREALLSALTPHLGSRGAMWVCVALHAATFFSKMLLLCGVQVALRWTLPRFSYARAMALCWKWIVPLSLLNLFATGASLLLFGGTA